MAGMPAYRYDHAQALPARQTRPAPAVRVVPGHKHTLNPALSDGAIFGIKVIIAVLVAFLVFGFVRVTLSSAAYDVASQASDMRAQVADARSTSDSLAVQESLLTSPSNLRAEAESRLSMTEATASSTMTLSADPVAIDSAGNLSFAGSVSRLSQ